MDKTAWFQIMLGDRYSASDCPRCTIRDEVFRPPAERSEASRRRN